MGRIFSYMTEDEQQTRFEEWMNNPVPCFRCGGSFRPFELYAYDGGLMLCESCLVDEVLEIDGTPPGFRAKHVKHNWLKEGF